MDTSNVVPVLHTIMTIQFTAPVWCTALGVAASIVVSWFDRSRISDSENTGGVKAAWWVNFKFNLVALWGEKTQ